MKMGENKSKVPSVFYGVVSARLISTFGTFLNMIALNIFILEVTGSAFFLGVAFASRIIAATFSSFYMGELADRYNRKFLMIASDIILAVFMLLLVFMPKAYLYPYLIFLMVLIGIFSSLFDISLQAAIPVIMNEKDVLKANSIFAGGRNIVIAASGLCAVFARYLFNNYNSIFILDAATYALSAVILLSLAFKTNAASGRPAPKLSFKNMINSYKEILTLPNAKIIYICMGILMLDAFASASHNLGWPVFSSEINPSSPMYYYGLILTFWAFGNLAGIYYLNKLSFLKKLRPDNLYIFFTAVMSFGMIMIFQTKITFIIIVSSFIAGIGDGTYQTFYATYIQQVKDSLRGRVFALTNFVLKSGFGLGFVAVPFAIKAMSVKNVVFCFHFPVIVISIAYLVFRNLLAKNAK
ncbi:MAG: MFS transporter [Armatimonadota bacterium]